MSDNEDIVEPIKKEKKPRTEKQKEAFEKMIAKRKEIDLVKNAHKEAIRKEKEIVRKDRVKKIEEVEQKMSKYQSEEEDEEDEIVEPVKISKPKPKPMSKYKPKKKIIVEESSSEEEEIIYVKKAKPKKKTKKKIVVEETSSESSEEEEPKPKKKSGNRSYRYNSPEQELVNQKSEEDIKQELHNQRLKSALRSLGYID